jgi:hypothetical protein
VLRASGFLIQSPSAHDMTLGRRCPPSSGSVSDWRSRTSLPMPSSGRPNTTTAKGLPASLTARMVKSWGCASPAEADDSTLPQRSGEAPTTGIGRPPTDRMSKG